MAATWHLCPLRDIEHSLQPYTWRMVDLFRKARKAHLWQYPLSGSETHGLPEFILEANPSRCVRIPQAPDERCLNLSTAVGIGLFEALRQAQS